MLELLLEIISTLIFDKKSEENSDATSNMSWVKVCAVVSLCVVSFFLSVSLICGLLERFIDYIGQILRENYFPSCSILLMISLLKLAVIALLGSISYFIAAKIFKSIILPGRCKFSSSNSFVAILKSFFEGFTSK